MLHWKTCVHHTRRVSSISVEQSVSSCPQALSFFDRAPEVARKRPLRMAQEPRSVLGRGERYPPPREGLRLAVESPGHTIPYLLSAYRQATAYYTSFDRCFHLHA